MNSEYHAYTQALQRDPADIVRQNLSELTHRQESIHTARTFWLSELVAGSESDALPDMDELQSLCEQFMPGEDTDDAYATAMGQADILALCAEIAARYQGGYERVFTELFDAYEPPPPSAQGRVAYVANNYTEQAFMQLTGFIKGRRVAYFHGFEDICQEVRSGLCEYGILPVESTSEGVMAGLLRLIELYDLRICALCYVPTPQSGSTAFALVRQTLPVQQPTAQHCIDLLLSPASQHDAAQLIGIASLCSHTLLHASTYTGEDGELFRLRFGVNPKTLCPFLTYLLVFCADITPIGFYTVN